MTRSEFFRSLFKLLPARLQRRLRRHFLYPPMDVAFDWEKAFSSRDFGPSAGNIKREANPLEAFFDGRKEGRGIWKWRHYFDIYHRHLQKFVNSSPVLMEIGIYSGGSLDMWKQYFGPGCRIVGVDIEPACRAYEDEQTSVFIGDQADRTFWRSIRNQLVDLDIVIDDGGHLPHQQIATFEEVFPLMKPGGVFICEDLAEKENRFADYAREVCSLLNTSTPVLDSKVLRYRPSNFQRCVASFHFYPFVVVVEKHACPGDVDFISPRHGTEWQPFL